MILTLTMATMAFGAPISSRDAQQAVQAWLRADAHPLDASIGQNLTSVETYNDPQGLPLYYVVYLQPAGYAIVPADDLIEPIIAFAAEGRYDPSPDNPLGALVSNDLPDRMQRVRKQAGARTESALKKAGDKWDVLRGIEKKALGVELGIATVSDVRVSPFVQSLWNQLTVGGTACYNYYTPPYASGSATNYYCGCVATAMAQLMRYHQHPVSGVGAASFIIYIKGVATTRSLRGGDGSGGAYSWSDMLLVPTGTVTLAQRQAIGALTQDAGVSVNMDYGDAAYGGSGANTLDAKTAFTDTFGYANAIKGYNSGSNIGAGLNAMVNPNLDSGYPVLFGITGSPGGHAIVCDGYGYNLGTLYHHLNLGWSGTDNAWYNLPTVDTSIGTFTSVYKCVYNVYVTGSGEIISGRVADNSGTALSNATVMAVRTGGATYTTNTNTRGIYAFPKVTSASTYTLSVVKTGYTFTNRIVSTGTSADLEATGGNSWAADFTGVPTAATVTLNNLTQTYDGSARTVTATTVPAGLTVNITYDGHSWAPTNAGTYAVTGVVADVTYQGSTNGTLTVNKGDQVITFPAIADQVITGALRLAATASSGLPVSFTNLTGSPVTWQNSTTITFTATGRVTIVASQAGDANWNAAPDIINRFIVTPPADESAGVCADYDGDGLADPAVYDETTGIWRVKLSASGYYLVATTFNGLGGSGSASVSADYDGDRLADPAVYQESSGVWTILKSSLNYAVWVFPQTLGGTGYSGMPADYDGDRLADPGVYQRESGGWKVLLSSAGYYPVDLSGFLGGTGYRAVAADYDGDHKADPAIYGENNGYWIFKLSSIGYIEIVLTQTLGGAGWIPVPADYDGDGLADPAVRSEVGNEWIVMFSSGNYTPAHLTIAFE